MKSRANKSFLETEGTSHFLVDGLQRQKCQNQNQTLTNWVRTSNRAAYQQKASTRFTSKDQARALRGHVVKKSHKCNRIIIITKAVYTLNSPTPVRNIQSLLEECDYLDKLLHLFTRQFRTHTSGSLLSLARVFGVVESAGQARWSWKAANIWPCFCWAQSRFFLDSSH